LLSQALYPTVSRQFFCYAILKEFQDLKLSMSSRVQSINKESLTQIVHSLFMSSKAAKSVSLLLFFVIIYLLATFSWSVWGLLQPRTPINVEGIVNNSNSNLSTKVNIHQITRANLFGDNKSVTTKANNSDLNAPVTRLKLKLRGVYAASDSELAGAMIEAQNKQEVYRIGSKLPGASGLKLHKILSDRVIMSRGGKYETLLIEDFGQIKGLSRRNSSKSSPTDFNNDVYTTNNKNIVDKRKDQNLTKELIKLRSKLSDPQSLSELVSVSPALEGDTFQGFRIAPGKNRALFGKLGLRRNDIITGVNGITLDDPAGAFSLMEQISSAEEINLTIKRGKKELNILFNAKSQ